MILLLLLTIVLTLAISFVSSITEAVLLSLNPLRLKAEGLRGGTSANRWLKFKDRIERPLSAILILNTLANTGLATVAAAIFVSIAGAEWLWVFSISLTIGILFGTELVPKILGVNHAERIAPLVAPFLSTILFIFTPAVTIMERVCQFLKPNGGNGNSTPRDSHIMDIITLTQAAKAENMIHSYEEIMIIHAATLSARRVRQIMIPPDTMLTLPGSASIAESITIASSDRFSRYPVTANGTEGSDSVIGYVNIKDLVAYHLRSDNRLVSAVALPILTISAETSLTTLLELFYSKKQKIALVKDRKEQTLGIVTLDDIVDLLIGNTI